MQLFAIKLVSFKNKCIFKIVIFYVLLATSWSVITTIPVLLSVLLPKVPRSIVDNSKVEIHLESVVCM